MSPCIHPCIRPFIQVDLNVMCVTVNVGLQANMGQKGETKQVYVVLFFFCHLWSPSQPLSLNIHLITFFFSIYLTPSLTSHILGRKKKTQESHIYGWTFLEATLNDFNNP